MIPLEYDISAVKDSDHVVLKDEAGNRYRISGKLLAMLAAMDSSSPTSEPRKTER